MKLSEAIEKGMPKTGGVARHVLFRNAGGQLHACALGTAVLGAGVLSAEQALRQGTLGLQGLSVVACLEERLEAPRDYLQHPVTARFQELLGIVSELNDTQCWSREKIVAWLKECGS